MPLMLPLPLLAEPPKAKVVEGTLQGAWDERTGVRSFKGVPFAAPPVGDLRWREPRPAKPWRGVRLADRFASRPMQLPLFGDMIFRSPGTSEDCLYLNVWAPPQGKRLPVLVYFYGGGFQAGAADEPRYDGASMAKRGIVAITVNYRLGPFGFLAHPELTRESPHRASGNYGLLDQAAALRWVRKNVAAFGGDPKRITIGGESAGSYSVSAQMASPLSRGLIAGAIGESGAALNAVPLAEAERNGLAFGKGVGAPTLKDLRAMPAEALLEAAKATRFGLDVDGYFLAKTPLDVYRAGEQAKVPLLAGWNAAESGAGGALGNEPATPEGFARALARLYPEHLDEARRAYPASTDAEVRKAATDLASDRFIGYGTWKWTEIHAKTGGRPVYRYFYTQPRPGEAAGHSAEIEYALGNLDLNPHYAWTDDDRKTSAAMQGYFANFIASGSPNGFADGHELPDWFALQTGITMRLGPNPIGEEETRTSRYRFLDSILGGR